MKDRILNNCIVFSLLIHLSLTVIFWSQNKNQLADVERIEVKLISQVERELPSPENISNSKSLGSKAETQSQPQVAKTHIESKIPTEQTKREKSQKEPELSVKQPPIPPEVKAEILEKELAPVAEVVRAEQPTIKTELQVATPKDEHVSPADVTEHKTDVSGTAATVETETTAQGNAFAEPMLLNPSLVTGTNPPPRYPKIARRRGWEGEVWLIAQITTSGEVQDVHLEQSSGYAVLDQTALKTVRSWLFKPQTLQNRLVEYKIRIPIQFQLRNS